MAADDPHSINIDGKNEHEREHDARTLLCEKWRRSLTSRRIRLVSLRSLKMLVIFLMATRWPVSEHVAELRTSARGTRLAPYGTEGRRMRASEVSRVPHDAVRADTDASDRLVSLGQEELRAVDLVEVHASESGREWTVHLDIDRDAALHRVHHARFVMMMRLSTRPRRHVPPPSEQEHTALADYRGARAMRCDGDASRAAANERPSDLHHDLKSYRHHRQPANLSCPLYGTRCVTLPSAVLAVAWMYLRVFGSF